MIASEFRTVYNASSQTWPTDAKAFCLTLLTAFEQLEQRVKKLEDQQAINSRNSSQSPSKDKLNKPAPKPKSLRQPTDKRPGGQVGHQGKNKPLRDNPDHTFFHHVGACSSCGHDLSEVEPDRVIRRQVEDLPPIKTVVTEHRIEVKTCPCCARQSQAAGCPVEVQHEFQYGPVIRSLCLYLSTVHFIPAKRTKQLLSVLGVDLSVGFLDNFRKQAAGRLRPFMAALRVALIKASVVHVDETGLKVKGVGHWVDVVCNQLLSYFALHRKRGRGAHESMGVLALFKGLLHRDDYHSYHDYPAATHSLCCAHLLRDLIYAIERDGQEQWAAGLITLLLQIKAHVEASVSKVADPECLIDYQQQYRVLIEQGLALNPPAIKVDGGRRGKAAQTKTVNLLLRLRDKEAEVLRFATHAEAEFDNNLAERDLRMNKLRQKVSGGFRSAQAGEEFMQIRSFVLTAIKQKAEPVAELVKLLTPGNYEHMRFVAIPE